MRGYPKNMSWIRAVLAEIICDTSKCRRLGGGGAEPIGLAIIRNASQCRRPRGVGNIRFVPESAEGQCRQLWGSGLGLLAGQSFVVWTNVAFGTGDGLSNRILTEIMIAVSGIIHRQMLY